MAGACVIGLDLAPRGRQVEHPVDGQRRGLLAAIAVEISKPGETELRDRVRVDLFERAEALLVAGAADREPLGARIIIGCGMNCSRDQQDGKGQDLRIGTANRVDGCSPIPWAPL